MPWADRIGPGDLTPGVLAPAAPGDYRLEPGYTGGEFAADTDPAEASQTRAQAMRAAEWHEQGLARRLRHHADLLDARLVDPLWRVFASRALQIAA